LAKIRAVVFEKNVKTANSYALQLHKNDAIESKATLKTSKGQFQQPFLSLMTLFLNFFANGCWNWHLLVISVIFGSMTSFLRNWSTLELSGFFVFLVNDRLNLYKNFFRV